MLCRDLTRRETEASLRSAPSEAWPDPARCWRCWRRPWAGRATASSGWSSVSTQSFPAQPGRPGAQRAGSRGLLGPGSASLHATGLDPPDTSVAGCGPAPRRPRVSARGVWFSGPRDFPRPSLAQKPEWEKPDRRAPAEGPGSAQLGVAEAGQRAGLRAGSGPGRRRPQGALSARVTRGASERLGTSWAEQRGSVPASVRFTPQRTPAAANQGTAGRKEAAPRQGQEEPAASRPPRRPDGRGTAEATAQASGDGVGSRSRTDETRAGNSRPGRSGAWSAGGVRPGAAQTGAGLTWGRRRGGAPSWLEGE